MVDRFIIRDYEHARSLVFEYIEAFYNAVSDLQPLQLYVAGSFRRTLQQDEGFRTSSATDYSVQQKRSKAPFHAYRRGRFGQSPGYFSNKENYLVSIDLNLDRGPIE